MARDRPSSGSQRGAGRWFRDLSPSPPPPLPRPWKAPPCQTQIFDWTPGQLVMRKGGYTNAAFPTARRSTQNPHTWRLTKELIQVKTSKEFRIPFPWMLIYFGLFTILPQPSKVKFSILIIFFKKLSSGWTNLKILICHFSLLEFCLSQSGLTNKKYKPFQIMTEYKTFNFLAEVCVFVSSFQGKDLWNLSILFMEVRNLNYLLTWVYFLVLDSSRESR